MGRKRKRDKHLPTSVYCRHGAHYFVDKDGRWNRLGKSLGEAYRELANYVEPTSVRTVGGLCDRYSSEVLSSYAVKEQKNRAPHIGRIRAVFGEMLPTDVTAAHIAQFRDKLGERRGRVWGRPQLSLKALVVLSHMFSWALEWGLVERNPCAGVRRPPQARRTRYPTDAEFRAVYERCPLMVQHAMDLALLTGLRREDILRLDRDAITGDGLLVRTNKTGKPLLFKWTDELRKVVEAARNTKPRVRRFLICNRSGTAYSPDGFSTIWRRAREKALSSGNLGESFRFNDIRAKSASDDHDIDRASRRLGHTSRQTTERHYRRGINTVEPLR